MKKLVLARTYLGHLPTDMQPSSSDIPAVTFASDFSVGSSFQGRLRSAFSGQESRHDRLHQTTGVAAAIAAHQSADGIPGSVEAVNRLVAFVQHLGAAVH